MGAELPVLMLLLVAGVALSSEDVGCVYYDAWNMVHLPPDAAEDVPVDASLVLVQTHFPSERNRQCWDIPRWDIVVEGEDGAELHIEGAGVELPRNDLRIPLDLDGGGTYGVRAGAQSDGKSWTFTTGSMLAPTPHESPLVTSIAVEIDGHASYSARGVSLEDSHFWTEVTVWGEWTVPESLDVVEILQPGSEVVWGVARRVDEGPVVALGLMEVPAEELLCVDVRFTSIAGEPGPSTEACASPVWDYSGTGCGCGHGPTNSPAWLGVFLPLLLRRRRGG